MNIAIIIVGTVAAIVGISVATWSIINTRKRYYEEYRKEKHRAED
ncbi:MAG: hypothetical protein OXU23_06490 [Candidatus Poribacteria bacterium]|nr:hypothetical protein [Candidatus Poribacteria bacterium]